MIIRQLLLLGMLGGSSSWAATASLSFVSDAAGSGVFVFNVNGQTRRLFCDQFLPNATTLPYTANVATLGNLTGSILTLQGDAQALFKYQRVAILDLIALADPSLAVSVVKANRRIVDGSGPLTSAAQALYDFVLTANAADYDLSGFRIYTNVLTQEVTGFDPGFVQICKVAGAGVTVGTNFNFNVAGTVITVPAGAAPGGTCSAPMEVPVGSTVITETLPAGIKLAAVNSAPGGSLVSSNLATGTATVTAVAGGLTSVTFIDTVIPPTIFTGFLQVCKVAGSGVLIGTNASFNVAGTNIAVPAGPSPGGSCSPAIEVPAGPTVIIETPPNGIALTGVSTLPSGLLVSTNLAANSATVTVNAGGQTIATFINAEIPGNPGTGFVQICKVAGPGVTVGANFNFQVAGTPVLVSVPAGAAPGGACSAAQPVPAGAIVISESLLPGYTLTSVSTSPAGLLASTDPAAGAATVTVNPGGQTIVTFLNSYVALVVPEPESSYHIRYVSNLNLGDSVINITNSGAGGAGLAAGTDAGTTGAFCANVYAFSPDEQMVSCCSCPVTPNGLVSLSAWADLVSNTLTPAVPTSLVIKILATRPSGGSCVGSAASATAANLAPGLAAWGTTLHVGPAELATTEAPFLPATLTKTPGNPGDISELSRLTQLCTFINANGSGFGICRSCRLGGLGSGRL